jgi:hypothetical protein
VDQDVTPEWWDERADRQRVEEAVEAWRREHVFAEGEHSISTGIVYALSSATVTAHDSATVTAYGSAMVVYPRKNKIVYPAGWTAETHD